VKEARIMRTMNECGRLAVPVLAALILAAWTYPAAAQSKLQQNPGGYHGELDFPISWKQYYSYAEWTKIMHDLQKKYPQLADIQSIGKSRMGRDQFLLTLTSKAAGPADSKTAMWVDGAVHGNEVNGITCSLYLAWYLLTRYDYDPYVYRLLNEHTFYILPGLNVDANDSFVSFPNDPNNPREPYRPEDNDGDGLYDEDQTEDVDGDGQISMMWIVDPEGTFKLSPDGRRFVPVADPTEQVRRFRRIGQEGYDNDGDGRINEDDIGGPDPNRNYPYDWNLSSGWPYTMSEPETRNAYEFQRTHPNIFASFHYHNTGRLIMFSAPPAVPAATTTQGAPGGGGGGRGGQQSFAERLARERETNQYAWLFDRQVPAEYRNDMASQTEIVSMGARILKDYTPTISGLTGQAQAASYYMLGNYAYLIELWGAHLDADTNGDGRVSEEEYLQWSDIELTGEGWITPHPVQHPDLGEVWIGGGRTKHANRTPPPRYMEEEALRNAHFVLYCASQFPHVEVGEVKVRPAGGELFWVDVAVGNDRAYPTSSDRDVVLRTAVMDRLTFKSSAGISLVEIGGGPIRIDPNDPGSAVAPAKAETELRLTGHDSRTYRYLVRVTGSGGWVEFTIASQNGGTATRRVEIRIQD
jgi:hypothetical protein